MFSSVFQLIFPSTCAVCGQVLVGSERQICLDCLEQLQQARIEDHPHSLAEMRLQGRVPYTAALSAHVYIKEGVVQHAVHAMKFRGCTELCRLMGRQMGQMLTASGRFDQVDVLVPVPLHWLRQLHRGYNQSHLLCLGIGDITARPVECRSLIRRRYTRQQSLRRGNERADAVAGAFAIRHRERLEGKHVLLVDDVLTTGSTLSACATALATVPGISISVATFSIVT